MTAMGERKTWTPGDVVDVSGPPALLRNYLEQRVVRECVQRAELTTPITRAYDVGCGFGRLTPVLSEFAPVVIGFEREASLLGTARELLPSLEFVEVETLEALPAPDASAEFVMTFTVLQHMPDARAEAVISELTRVLAPGGHVLVVEETDPTLEAGDAANAEAGYTRGRPWSWYQARLAPLRLIRMGPRVIEPGYPRADVGTYMLFGSA
jgi:SAM-dependent methyltransferase